MINKDRLVVKTDVELLHLLEIINPQPPELLFLGRTNTETTGHQATSQEYLGTQNPGLTERRAYRGTDLRGKHSSTLSKPQKTITCCICSVDWTRRA